MIDTLDISKIKKKPCMHLHHNAKKKNSFSATLPFIKDVKVFNVDVKETSSLQEHLQGRLHGYVICACFNVFLSPS